MIVVFFLDVTEYANEIISDYEKGATPQATIPATTTSLADQSSATTVDVASKTGTPSEDVRSTNNSEVSSNNSSVIAAEIQINIEIGYRDELDLGPDFQNRLRSTSMLLQRCW